MAGEAAAKYPTGDPFDAEHTRIGPLVSDRQRDPRRATTSTSASPRARAWSPAARSRPEPGLERGYYVTADGLRRRHAGHAHRAGGDLRAGAVDHALPDEDEALEIANGTEYGLAGGVWAADPNTAYGSPRGCAPGRSTSTVARSTSAPFGGFSPSGIGRELGVHGLEEFLEVKALLF